MTVSEAITAIRNERPNTVEEEQLISWLEDVDRRINVDVLEPLGQGVEETEYDMTTVLIVPDTFRQLYVYWLAAMIDYRYQEISMYNNDYVMFNSMFESFASWYRKKHGNQDGLKFKY